MHRHYNDILFQLSDVDIGGYTVFPEAGISVAPVKVKCTLSVF